MQTTSSEGTQPNQKPWNPINEHARTKCQVGHQLKLCPLGPRRWPKPSAPGSRPQTERVKLAADGDIQGSGHERLFALCLLWFGRVNAAQRV